MPASMTFLGPREERAVDAPAPDRARAALVDASRQRSRDYGVDSAVGLPAYREPNLDVPLVRAALPVLDGLLAHLSADPVSVMLTDREGVVLVRKGRSERLTGRLDRVQLAPGHVFSERSMGTNGIGTALASGQPVVVVGREHHVEALHPFHCAAMPVLHPTRRTLLGAVNVTTTRQASGTMLMALTHLLAGQVESQLAALGSRRERALFQDYMTACASVRPGPVMALNRDIVMANEQFRAAVTGPDHAAVLEHAQELAEDVGFEGTRTVALPSGRVADLRVTRSRRDAEDAGAVLQVRIVGRPQATPVPADRRSALGLVGGSPHWLRTVAEVRAAVRSGSSLCVVGEAGAGKTTLVHAAHRERAGRPLRVVEPPASRSATAARQWLTDVVTSLRDPSEVVLLRDAHRLDRHLRAALSDHLAERVPHGGAQLVLTRQGALSGADDDLDGHVDVRVEVPPLRHRPDDVEQLVRYFLRRHHPSGDGALTARALTALQQCLWPENVRQLESVVRELCRRPGRVIDRDDLPAECRVTSRSVLTPIEALERDAIVRALADTNANVQRSAQALGISRATMYRKMRRYGVAPA